MKNFVENQGIKNDKPLALTYEQLKAQLDAVVAECADLKSSREVLAKNALETCNDVFTAGFRNVHLQRGLMESTGNRNLYPNPIKALVDEAVRDIETPATSSALAEQQAIGVEKFATKRGFSFQHGSIHAHFGNGDVLVGSIVFENGHAGICFAPVREKDGGVGTEYKWTEGKNAYEVGAVFVISSSSVAGLEVIQGKLSEAIEQLRKGESQ